MDISVLVSCLTGLLKHTDIVTSPPVHSSIVQLLLAMLSPQVGSQWAALAAACPTDGRAPARHMLCM
jgi:hypothetical protein